MQMECIFLFPLEVHSAAGRLGSTQRWWWAEPANQPPASCGDANRACLSQPLMQRGFRAGMPCAPCSTVCAIFKEKALKGGVQLLRHCPSGRVAALAQGPQGTSVGVHLHSHMCTTRS